MGEGAFLGAVTELGIGVIALLALIYALKGREADEKASNVVVTQLVALVAAFQSQTTKHAAVLEQLIQKVQAQSDSLLAQNGAVVANTAMLETMNRNLKDEFMPSLTNLLTTNHQKTLAEFKPIAENLSVIALGVDALNKALLAHRESETAIMAAVQAQQGLLREELVKAEQKLEAIFVAVISDTAEVPATINNGSEGENGA